MEAFVETALLLSLSCSPILLLPFSRASILRVLPISILLLSDLHLRVCF